MNCPHSMNVRISLDAVFLQRIEEIPLNRQCISTARTWNGMWVPIIVFYTLFLAALCTYMWCIFIVSDFAHCVATVTSLKCNDACDIKYFFPRYRCAFPARFEVLTVRQASWICLRWFNCSFLLRSLNPCTQAVERLANLNHRLRDAVAEARSEQRSCMEVKQSAEREGNDVAEQSIERGDDESNKLESANELTQVQDSRLP